MTEWWLPVGVLLVALTYSIVGHGGASGYLALLAFTSISSKLSATTALVSNVIVAGFAFVLFQRAKHLDFNLVTPFLLASVPFAFLGGRLNINSSIQNVLLAITLLYAAITLLRSKQRSGLPANENPKEITPTIKLVFGSLIGLLSGIVGVGGGIFLSPLLIIHFRLEPHRVAAASAVFIFANSLAGLAARAPDELQNSVQLWPLWLAAAIGGLVGSWIGARQTTPGGLNRVLAGVLLLAVWKLATKAWQV